MVLERPIRLRRDEGEAAVELESPRAKAGGDDSNWREGLDRVDEELAAGGQRCRRQGERRAYGGNLELRWTRTELEIR